MERFCKISKEKKLFIVYLMKSYLLVFIFLNTIVLAKSNFSNLYCSCYVVGYYPEYNYWQMPVANLRYDKLTHIIYFSLYPNTDGSLNTSEINLEHLEELVETARLNNVKVCICVGGWNLSGDFSEMASSSSYRNNFINNIIKFCNDNDLDGINIDWEPVRNATDRNNYTILIHELKTAISGQDLILSLALSALGAEINSSAITDVDWINIMAYDMGIPHSSYDGAVSALDHWEDFGFSKSKEILGLPFYGRDADFNYYSYKYIIDQFNPDFNIDEISGINFNGVATVKEKTKYIIDNAYGGVAIWDITQDSLGIASLLSAISDSMLLNLPPDYNCDKIINHIDLDQLLFYWLDYNCGSYNLWCEGADRNQSQYVTLQDYVLFAEYWLAEVH